MQLRGLSKMTKQTFISEVEEDLDREHKVTLSEGQISTILYVLEGYIQGNDDYDEESVFYQDINDIFKSLEGTIDRFYQRPDLGKDSTEYQA